MAEQLGAYLLDKRIGAGGMADVFLARGPSGVCVIKRPHPHLCASADFVRMFLDEASLLAQLHHPSIAQIFDLGQQNGVYFLAMEYVPGFDLMTISLEHERQGEYMAPELAAKLVADAAGALHYAHDAVGANGEPLHIIHRDVSPHNVLVSTRGEVKLIDFGVARAAKTMHRTQAGLVKGKYPYMSPEQITGQTIDRRVDVYALGLVLYELLTNARAIAGDLEVQQIENARHGRIKPVEQLRPNVPSKLRKILAGALHPQPEGRYQTAAALQADLEAYIISDRHVVGREDLVRLFRVVAAEASHLPPEFDSAPSPAAPLSSADTMRSGSYQGVSAAGPDNAAETMRSGSFVSPSPVPSYDNNSSPPPAAFDNSHHPTDQVPLPEAPSGPFPPTYTGPLATAQPQPPAQPPLPSPMPPGVHVGGAATPPLQLTAELAYPPHALAYPTAPDVPRSQTEAQQKELWSAPVKAVPAPPPAQGRSLMLPLLGAAGIALAAAGYLLWPRPAPVIDLPPPPPLVVKDPTPPPPDPVVEPKPPIGEDPKPPEPVAVVEPKAVVPAEPVKAAIVRVTTTPPMEVIVDKKSWGVTPAEVEVLAGKHTFVLQEHESGLKRTVQLQVAGGDKRELNWAPKMGKLVVHVEPYGNIAIDGRVVRKGSSIADAELWEGKHQVIISNDELKKTITRPAEIKPGETIEITVNLVSDEK